MSIYLSNSIEPWQRAEIETIAKRAYLLGRKHQKNDLQTIIDRYQAELDQDNQ